MQALTFQTNLRHIHSFFAMSKNVALMWNSASEYYANQISQLMLRKLKVAKNGRKVPKKTQFS